MPPPRHGLLASDTRGLTANHSKPSMSVVASLLIIASLLLSLHPTEGSVGVCYGKLGNNLPSDQDVVKLFKNNGIGAMRAYSPDQPTLQALQGSGIKLILDVPNENIQSLAFDQTAAIKWVQTNVVPFASSIKFIAVGNEIHPSHPLASSVAPAMQNVVNALSSNNLSDQIKVSTSIDTTLITNSYPPSNAQFSDSSYISPIINILIRNNSPLLVNVYTYFSYKGDKQNISLDYALLNEGANTVQDGNLKYHNLFDAMVDSVYAALGKAGASNTAIVVSETGWPSDGEESATIDNAGTYYRNLINHVNQGTPLKPGQVIETYLFAMFDENQKTGDETERHFGLFSPDQQPKYGQLSFN